MKLLRCRSVRIVLDVTLLAGFIVEFLTREGPDYDLHSWIGVVLIPIIAIHLAGNWRWVTSTFSRRSQHPEWALARFNAVFSVVAAICLVTGFPLWLGWSDNGFWTVTHTVTGFASVVLSLSHLWRNRRRVLTLIRRQRAPAL